MNAFSIEFEMSDALIARAVREDCVAAVRERVALKEVLVIVASTVVFALAVIRESHWLWWFAGLPVLIFLLLAVVWLFAYFWLPRVAQAKLAHLPNRLVEVKGNDEVLSIQTANERLEVDWAELKAIKQRPSFCLLCLKSGTRIAIPAERLSAEAIAMLEAKLAAGHDAPAAKAI